MTELIIFRGVQGLGAGFIFSNIFTSIADVFPDPARRAKYQGIFFGVFALSSVIGPALGEYCSKLAARRSLSSRLLGEATGNVGVESPQFGEK